MLLRVALVLRCVQVRARLYRGEFVTHHPTDILHILLTESLQARRTVRKSRSSKKISRKSSDSTLLPTRDLPWLRPSRDSSAGADATTTKPNATSDAEPQEEEQEQELKPKGSRLSGGRGGVSAALQPIQAIQAMRPRARTSLVSPTSDAGESGPVAKFKAQVSEAQPKLMKLVDAFTSQNGIITTCDAVLAASGSGFEGVYLAVWNLIVLVEGDQIDLYVDVVQPLTIRAEDGPGRGQARQTVFLDVAELCMHAYETKTSYDKFVRAVGQATGASVDLPTSLKRISRIFEKILFDFQHQGSCEKVVDIVRGMLKANSMQQVTKIAMAFLESRDIVIVRIKDRFVTQPSHGGWRDLLINFYMADDPNCHVCEVQIVLEKMLVARKGLGGHEIFDRSRNALETLEALDARDPAKRWERAAYLRKVEDFSAGVLMALGFEVIDLMRAGYTENQLLYNEQDGTSSGVTDADLSSARDTITSERWQAPSKPGGQRQFTRSEAVDDGSFSRRLGGTRRLSTKVIPEGLQTGKRSPVSLMDSIGKKTQKFKRGQNFIFT